MRTQIIAAMVAAAPILAAGCGSASSPHHTPQTPAVTPASLSVSATPGWSTLTRTQERYVCNDIKALRIPGQTPTFPLAPFGNGYYQFPRDTAIQTQWNAFTWANGVSMIAKAVRDLCPYYKTVSVTGNGS